MKHVFLSQKKLCDPEIQYILPKYRILDHIDYSMFRTILALTHQKYYYLIYMIKL